MGVYSRKMSEQNELRIVRPDTVKPTCQNILPFVFFGPFILAILTKITIRLNILTFLGSMPSPRVPCEIPNSRDKKDENKRFLASFLMNVVPTLTIHVAVLPNLTLS